MKKNSFIILLLLLNSSLLFGQNDQQKEAEVRAMEVVEAQALLQKDTVTLRKIWAPDFMVNAPINIVAIGGQVELVSAGILSYTSFTRQIEHVRVLKDIVITMGSETVVPSGFDPMAGQTIQRRYSNIWMKDKGKWILVARHANNICTTSFIPGSSGPTVENSTVNSRTVKVQNNPAHSQFELVFGNTQQHFINIYDNNARLIERLAVKDGVKTIIIGQNYAPGIYFAHVISGSFTKTIKLVKL